ncbi:hypothetical protein LLEC1_04734 [Akanthomyces lecanii]|uniref:SCP domain-containing protein n=1 Tax=Cordyceps confragosa TaxID=2714763 RepID=A0A179HZR5_CORDF|nr:hypothetical protein LLEC1_04734 [Akanthomyces lecanii]
MQLTTALVASLLSAATTAMARSVPRAYPGISEEQSRNAGAAIWQALQESELEVYANPRVPESYSYPYNREGGDQDSVGMFQQRKAYYPDIAADMDPARSTGQFLDAMLRVPGWEHMEISQLDQAVQHAEAGNLYGKRIPLATQICNAAGF